MSWTHNDFIKNKYQELTIDLSFFVGRDRLQIWGGYQAVTSSL